MSGSHDTRADGYRSRLTAGLASALAGARYAELNIADIVRHARVSKRTFYEHFGSKAECLLGLYEAESERLLARIEDALAAAPPGEARVRAGVVAYLAALRERPAVVRTLLVEILSAGAAGLAVRRVVIHRFAELLLREHAAAGAEADLPPVIATALAGGINELILEAVEQDRVEQLPELVEPVVALVAAALSSRGVRHAVG